MVIVFRNPESRAWRDPSRHTWATTGCVECNAVPDRSAAARNVWGGSFAAVDGNEEAGVEDQSPNRSAMAAISWSLIGPASASHVARKEPRASCL